MRFGLFIFLIILISIRQPVNAARADTVEIFNPAAKLPAKAVLIFPDVYFSNDTILLPVIYLLHGWSGKYSDWPKKIDLKPLSDKYGFLIVCPDGGYAGWYLDSPLDSTSKYFSYLAESVVPYIDQHYRTINIDKGRAICGLSMGGQGAINFLARRPDLFCAAGSMSGVMHLSEASKKLGITRVLGDFDQNEQAWRDNSAINLVDRLKGLNKGLIIECGVEDRYLESNRRLHAKLLDLKINHDYCERPGGHSWEYWTNALEYHLMFFSGIINYNNFSE